MGNRSGTGPAEPPSGCPKAGDSPGKPPQPNASSTRHPGPASPGRVGGCVRCACPARRGPEGFAAPKRLEGRPGAEHGGTQPPQHNRCPAADRRGNQDLRYAYPEPVWPADPAQTARLTSRLTKIRPPPPLATLAARAVVYPDQATIRTLRNSDGTVLSHVVEGDYYTSLLPPLEAHRPLAPVGRHPQNEPPVDPPEKEIHPSVIPRLRSNGKKANALRHPVFPGVQGWDSSCNKRTRYEKFLRQTLAGGVPALAGMKGAGAPAQQKRPCRAAEELEGRAPVRRGWGGGAGPRTRWLRAARPRGSGCGRPYAALTSNVPWWRPSAVCQAVSPHRCGGSFRTVVSSWSPAVVAAVRRCWWG